MSIVIIAEPNASTAERLLEAAAAAGASELSRTNTLEDVLDLAEQRDVAVVVIGPDLIDDLAFTLARHLGAGGTCSTVMVAHQMSADLMRQALRSGVTDVVEEGESLGDITAAIERAFIASEKARQAGAAQASCNDGERGKVVTVFSAKGGVGKTAVATNLAVALSTQGHGRVALIDLDLEFGDVAIVLGIKPRRTIFDAVQVFDRLDGDMLEGFLEEHQSGLRVLIAPVRPEEAETIAAAHIAHMIELLRCRFDYVVVDTCPSFSEGVLAALDRSDEIYLVASTDVTAIKNARVAVQKLRQLGYDTGLVKVVLNRADNRLNMPTHEVEEAIGLPVAYRVPSDIVVPRSQNKGVTVIQEAPRSDVAKSLISMARMTSVSRESAGNVVS